MENQGLNNDVSVGDRKFHVQSHFSAGQSDIIVQVFHEGQLMESREVPTGNNLTDAELGEQLKEFHQGVITEIEILYYIYEKVKAVKHPASANKLGLVFLQKNLIREAIEQFRLALELEPTFSEVWGNLGRALIMQDAYEEAIQVLRKGVTQAPAYADIRNFLGTAYFYAKDYDSSIEQLQRAIALNPNYIGAHFLLGIALLAKLGHEEGEETEEEAQVQRQAYERDALSSLQTASERMVSRQISNFDSVMKLVQEKDYAKAVDEVLLSKPGQVLNRFTNLENEFYLKFMYGGKGKDDGFISSYVDKLEEVLHQHPDYADLHNNLGVANLIQCRNLFLKALDEFRQALKINPDFKKAQKNLKLAENDGKGFLILLRAVLK